MSQGEDGIIITTINTIRSIAAAPQRGNHQTVFEENLSFQANQDQLWHWKRRDRMCIGP